MHRKSYALFGLDFCRYLLCQVKNPDGCHIINTCTNHKTRNFTYVKFNWLPTASQCKICYTINTRFYHLTGDITLLCKYLAVRGPCTDSWKGGVNTFISSMLNERGLWIYFCFYDNTGILSKLLISSFRFKKMLRYC